MARRMASAWRSADITAVPFGLACRSCGCCTSTTARPLDSSAFFSGNGLEPKPPCWRCDREPPSAVQDRRMAFDAGCRMACGNLRARGCRDTTRLAETNEITNGYPEKGLRADTCLAAQWSDNLVPCQTVLFRSR